MRGVPQPHCIAYALSLPNYRTRYAVRCLDFFCTALQLTVMTSQAYTLAQGRMRKALGVTVAGGHSLELVYWHKGGPVPSGNRPVPHFSVLKIELIREMRAEGDSSGNTDAGSGGGGGGGGGVSAGTTATSSSSSSRSATPIQTPTPLGESNNHTILRAVHTPPLLDPATDHPFDFTALCTEVSVPLLLDKAMQLQTHIQLKRIHDELEAAATTAATEASTPTTPTTTTTSTSTFTTAGPGSGSSSGTATGAASVGTTDNLAARHVTYTLHEGLSEDYSNVSRLDFTFQGSSQSPASPTQAAPITISLTYGARGFSFYEDGQQGLVRKQCAGAATGTVEGFYLNQAAHALNAGISSAAEAIKRLQARASLADLAVQGRRCGLDAIFVHQPLIARMADNPHRVLHMRFRHFPLFTFVVELQADGIEEQYFLLQSESANGSPLVQTNYTQWSLSSLPSVQILHSMNGDAVGEGGGEGGGGASAEAGIGGAAAETEDDGDERPRQRLKLDPLAGNAATSNANANTNAATTFGNVVHLCQQQIPMVLLSQQLSAMNFSYTLDAAGSKAVIHHHAVISGKRLYADVESMQFAVRGAECRVELIFAAESLCGRASKALAICGHDNVTFNPETRQVAFEYKEVNSCVGGFFFHFEIACYLFELVVMLPTPGSEVATLWPLPPGFSCEFGFTHLAFAYGGGHRAFVEWSPEHQVFSLALSTTLPGRNPHSQIGRQLSDELFGDVDINEVLATLALTLGPLTCLQACTKFEAEMSYLARSPTCGLLTCHGVCALELTFVAESRVRIKDGGCVWQEQQQDAGARASASSVDHGNSKAAKHASMKPVVNLLAFVQKHGASSVDAVTGVLELPLSTFEAICSVDSAAGGGRCLLHAFMVSQKAVAAASQ